MNFLPHPAATPGELLDFLQQAGIKLTVADGRLNVDAPRGAVTPALRDLLVAQRDALLAHLTDQIPSLPRDGGLPLSFAQQRLWLLDKLEGGSPRYNVISATRLLGKIDGAALQDALQELLARHEILRSQFELGDDGVPRQYALHDLPVPLIAEDCRPTSEAIALQQAIASETRHRFSLAQAPLWRVKLLQIATDHYILLCNLHHIITDAWSNDIFASELARLYAAKAIGARAALPVLQIQYADFAVWQRNQLNAEKLAAGLAFWRDTLRDLPPLLSLPTDFPRPSTHTYRGDAVPVRIPTSMVSRLQRLAQTSQASLFMLLTAALALCLGRHAYSDDIAIGTPVAGRNRPELESMIGFFINAVVLRCRLAPNESFRQLLGQVRENSLRAFAQQDTPFEQIVDALSGQRDLSYTPLFQVMLSYINRSELVATPASGFRAERIVVAQHDVLFDLDWQLRETDQGVEGFLIYATSLFTRQTAERLVAHFMRTLELAVDQPDLAIARFDILSQQERDDVLYQWNATQQIWPHEGFTPQRIANQAARTPEATAVRFGNDSWSYRELDLRAAEIAAGLRAHGVRPGARVGICLGRTPQMLAALLGVWKAGAAYVPLDPVFPADRLSYMVQDAAATLTLSEAAIAYDLRERLGIVAPVLTLETLSDLDPVHADLDEGTHLDLSDDPLAYVIYTSGSTGQPKGVMIGHVALDNFLRSMQREPGLQASDVLLAVTTISFDISLLELFLPLTVGAQVIIAPQLASSRPQQLMQLIADSAATVMQATPATWRMLLAAGWTGASQLKALCGGEALPRDLSRQLLGKVGALWNMYGPTETTIWSAVRQICAEEAVGDGIEPVGTPIANTQLYVLNEALQPSPIGSPGELYIGGAGLAHGYWQRAELSAEKFIANPFMLGGKLYRTGDSARYAPDGSLHFLGRLDHQVKLRGFRIELGEIESLLGRHPAMVQCCVIIREDVAGDQRLVAYYVADPSSELEDAHTVLREHLRTTLPDYMLPTIFIELPAMPLTPNGKVDRKVLPIPLASPPASRPEKNASELELKIAAAWSDILHRPEPGLHCNFFDLGGHSLLVVQLHQRLSSELGITFDALDLFRHPTIAQQAALLGGQVMQTDVRSAAQSRAQQQRNAMARQRAIHRGK